MLIGKVVGTLVSTHKEEKLKGLKFYVLQKLDMRGKPEGGYVVAVDAVGSGEGEYVIYASGSSARYTRQTEGKPADAAITGIIDTWDVDGAVQYDKSKDEARKGR
ncbi:MAG: EutN/CcmL family microcompartment protein [Candidatus Tritonobacter lacicola]|nr:EutN/CcmL family microcompartment protein [Candidatus Tritonobacter lacicola]